MSTRRNLFKTTVAVSVVLASTLAAGPALAAPVEVDSGGKQATQQALRSAGVLPAQPNAASSGLEHRSTDLDASLNPSEGASVPSVNKSNLQMSIADQTAKSGQRTKVSGADATIYGSTSQHNYVIAKPEAGAVRGYVVVHSYEASSDYGFRITNDGDEVNLSLTDEGAVIITGSDGTFINSILPAWAKDANGQYLETSYTVQGPMLIQHVDLSQAAFPVVADPEYACDWASCTLEFNRSETKTVADNGWQATGVAGGWCLLGGPELALACAALGAWVTITASQAYNQGDCLGIRNTLVSPVYPVIYNADGNCY